MRRSSGKVSIAQIVGLAILAVGIYFGWMYLPVLSHKMAMDDLARTYAARMLIDYDDTKMREEIRARAKSETGIEIGHMSELFLERRTSPKIKRVVTIKWTEQVKHVWGKNHVLKMSVSQSIEPGGKVMKNAE